MNETLILNKKTDLVVLIAMNENNRQRFESAPFEFKGQLTREEKLKLIPSSSEIDSDTPIYFTSHFLHKEGNTYTANIANFDTDVLIELNKIQS